MEHNHRTIFSEVSEGEEFSFHPFLASFIRQKFSISVNDILVVYEKTCESSDCPIQETIVEFIKEEKKYKVRFPRKKEQISKMDLSFVKLEEVKRN
ncbi:MAG: hypothetical protein N3A69_00345 [Leptospiraceae bacterium]|nr:hypothetical protein [Leptospiraceae bacterium]